MVSGQQKIAPHMAIPRCGGDENPMIDQLDGVR